MSTKRVDGGTITDVSPYQTLVDDGYKTENRKAAVSDEDGDAFIFWTESAARFWLKAKTGSLS